MRERWGCRWSCPGFSNKDGVRGAWGQRNRDLRLSHFSPTAGWGFSGPELRSPLLASQGGCRTAVRLVGRLGGIRVLELKNDVGCARVRFGVMGWADQRKSDRYVIRDEQQGVLKIGERRTLVRLLDESTGGFSVLADHLPKVDVHQKVELGTSRGWCRVRVVHISEVRVNSPRDGGDLDEASSEYRVGLRRVIRVRGQLPYVSPEAVQIWYRLGLQRLGEVEAPVEAAGETAGTDIFAPGGVSWTTALIFLGVASALTAIALSVAWPRMF